MMNIRPTPIFNTAVEVTFRFLAALCVLLFPMYGIQNVYKWPKWFLAIAISIYQSSAVTLTLSCTISKIVSLNYKKWEGVVYSNRPLWGNHLQRCHCRFYPNRIWYSIQRPRRDAMLSWPRHCSRVAQPVPEAAYRSGCRDKHNRPRWDSNLGPDTR